MLNKEGLDEVATEIEEVKIQMNIVEKLTSKAEWEAELNEMDDELDPLTRSWKRLDCRAAFNPPMLWESKEQKECIVASRDECRMDKASHGSFWEDKIDRSGLTS